MGTADTSRCSWRVFMALALVTVVVVEECTGVAVETTHLQHDRNHYHPRHHRHHHRRHHNHHHHQQQQQRKIPIPVSSSNLQFEAAEGSGSTRDKRQGWTSEWESGPWGEWSVPSPCSRTCGGGVNYRTRTCQGASSEQCVGKTKKYESCNNEPCPEGSIDFRTEQCQRYNDVPFEGKYYSWVPHYKAPRKCELNCQPEGERFYFRHALKVVDGTPCDNEGFDVCVDGQCMPVGCDLILGSSAREDKCRMCGGDGSTCNTIKGDFMQETLTVGYNDIVLIPAGATSIYPSETPPDTSTSTVTGELTSHERESSPARPSTTRGRTMAALESLPLKSSVLRAPPLSPSSSCFCTKRATGACPTSTVSRRG